MPLSYGDKQNLLRELDDQIARVRNLIQQREVKTTGVGLLETTPAEPSTTGMPWEQKLGIPESPTPELKGFSGFLQRFVRGAEKFPEEMIEAGKGLAQVSTMPAPQRSVALGQMAGEVGKDVFQRLTRPSKTWKDPFGTVLYLSPGMVVGGAKLAGAGLKGLGKAVLRRGGTKALSKVTKPYSAADQLWLAGERLKTNLGNIFEKTEGFYKKVPSKLEPKELTKQMGDIWEGDIAEGIWELQRFKRQFKKAVPHEGWRETVYRWMDDQRTALKENRPNKWQKELDMLPVEARESTIITREILDLIYDIETKAGIAGEYKKLYMPHWWKTETPKVKGRFFRKTSPHAKEQVLETVEEGFKAGLEPRSTDLLDVLDYRIRNAIKISSNKRLIENLRSAVDPETGNSLIVNATEAHAQGVGYWPRIDAKGLHRKPFIREAIHVHPDIAPQIKTLFGERSGAFRALLSANAFAKKTLLAVSLFHWHALTESAIASGVKKEIAPGLREAGRALWGKEGRKLPKGLSMYWEGDPHLRMGIRNGLVLGPTEDVGRAYGMVNKAVESIEGKIPLFEKPGKIIKATLGKMEQAWDRALWDTYHGNFKAYAFVEHYHRLLQKKPSVPTQKLAEEAARLTNFAFGGLNWRRLMVEPKYRNYLQVAFLAPDWTLSNLGVALSAIPGAGKMPVLGRFAQTAGFSRAQYAKYWLRAITYFTGFTELANYSFTKLKTGKGHFTWDNPPGHEFDVELPYRAPDQQGNIGDRYLKIGKQFKEPFRLAWDIAGVLKGKELIPQIVKGKTGIIPRFVYEQLTGKSMYGYSWLHGSTYQPREMTGYEEIGRRLGHTVEEITPIPVGYGIEALRGKDVPSAAISAFGFPVSKGVSKFKLSHEIAQAEVDGDSAKAQKLKDIARTNGLWGRGKGQFNQSTINRLKKLLRKK